MSDDPEMKRLESAVESTAHQKARDDERDAIRQYMTMDVEAAGKLERAMSASIGNTIATGLGATIGSRPAPSCSCPRSLSICAYPDRAPHGCGCHRGR